MLTTHTRLLGATFCWGCNSVSPKLIVSLRWLGAVMSALFILPASGNQCCLVRPASIELSVETVADGLRYPWGMVFLPDGSVLVTERRGALRRVVDGEVSAAFAGVPTVADVGQGGLLDVALDPAFEKNRTVFFSFSEPSYSDDSYGAKYSTAVARAALDVAGMKLTDVKIIFSANKKSGGGRHFGSRIRFAADNTLFITLGDRGTQLRAQDPFDHAGKVIRINRDGTVPEDNPFADGKDALAEIWSLGHRNAQGAAIHPTSGKLWTLAHGAAGGDEVNIVERGRNYGWPIISYGRNYFGTGFAKGAAAPGYEQPIYYWDPSIAPSGFDFYAPDNPLIPAWQGSVLAGALRGRHLSRLILDGDRIIAEEVYLKNKVGRIRDVRAAPDGAVYVLTDSKSGKLLRITQK